MSFDARKRIVNLILISAKPGDHTEKHFFSLKFQDNNYSGDALQDLMYDKLSLEFFPFFQYFPNEKTLLIFFFTNGCQILDNFLYPNITFFKKI